MKQLIFILPIFLIACSVQVKKTEQATEKQNINTQFQVAGFSYVILDYKADWYWMFKNVKPSTISENELAEIEKIIERAVKENNEQELERLENHNNEYPNNQWTETGFELTIEGFKRQYVSVINDKGQKEVWINFFCNDWGSENWKSDIMIVLDGGNCYFNLKVNLETKAYSELSINGYA